MIVLLLGLALGGRFLFYYLQDPEISRHIQSLLVGVGAIVLAFIVGLMAFMGDLLATNRRLSEEMLARLRRIDAELAQVRSDRGDAVDGITSTGAQPWVGNAPHPAAAAAPEPAPAEEASA